MRKLDKEIKRKIGALVVLGMFVAIALCTSVTADVDTGVWVSDDTGNDVTLSSGVSSYDVGIGDADPSFKLEVAGSSGSGYFGISSGVNSPGNIFMIDSNGKVGIGTQVPGAKLDVHVGFEEGGAATIGTSSNSATGDYAIAMGSGNTASGIISIAMGQDSIASGYVSTAMGYSSAASGLFSTAMGYETAASEQASTAMGSSTTASGKCSTAMGSQTTASGNSATAMGANTQARGPGSTAMGLDMIVDGDYSFGIGLDAISPVYWQITQPNTMAIMGGNVGIGTTTPDMKLTIIDEYIDPKIRVGESTSTSGVFSWDVSDNELRINTYSNNYPIELGNNWLYIKNDGNVGIGTANPGTAKLAVIGGNVGIGTTEPDEKLTIIDASGDAKIRLGDSLSSSGIFSWDNYNNALRINTYSNNYPISLGNDWLYLKNNGDIGIGTPSPQGQLHLQGSANTDANIYLDQTGINGDLWRIISTNINLAGDGGDLAFYNEDEESYVMLLRNNGNVGIGEMTPDTRLDIDEGAIEMKEISDPGTPLGNNLRLFAIDDDGETKLAYKDSLGTVTQLGSSESPFLKYHNGQGTTSSTSWTTIVDIEGPWTLYQFVALVGALEAGDLRVTADGATPIYHDLFFSTTAPLSDVNILGDGFLSMIHFTDGSPGGIKASGSTSLKIEIKCDESADTIDYMYAYGN